MSTFYVDRDGRNSSGVLGNDSLTSPGWSMVTRAGDPTKPFATIGAALTNVVSSDIIIVRKEKTSTEYAPVTISGKTFGARTTIQSLSGEQPNIGKFQLDNCTNIKLDGFKFFDTMRLGTVSSVSNIEIYNCDGRSKSTTGSASGNLYLGTFSNSTFSNVDLSFNAAYTLNKAVVGINVVTGGVSNQFLGCRIDNFPGDGFNGPSAVGMDDWLIDGMIWSRCRDNGTVHVDGLQWACGSDNFILRNSIFMEGIGRLMIMPQQDANNSTTGLGGHTNMQVYNNVWLDTTDFGAQFYNCPGLNYSNNTMMATRSGNSNYGLYLPATQSVSLIAQSMWTRNVRMKNNILSGIKVFTDVGHGGADSVTFTSDTGGNIFLDANARSGYTKTATDRADGVPQFVDTSHDAVNENYPNMRLIANSRGINEGVTGTGVPSTDAVGASRGTSPDVGAYEFGGGGGGSTSGTAGPLPPTAVTQDTSPAGNDWVNLNNLLLSDNNYATVGLNSGVASGNSQRIRATYSLPIPSDGTVKGVTVTLSRKQTTSQQIHSQLVQLWAGGAAVGTAKSVSTAWPTTETDQVFGSATDTWGMTESALTAAVMASDFQVAFIAQNSTGTSATAAVDVMTAAAAWETSNPNPDSPPVGAFSMSPNPATEDDTILFDASFSTGVITSYQWSLDDGLTYTINGFNGVTDSTASIVAIPAGTYQVRLRVEGPGGVDSSSSKTLVVGESTGGTGQLVSVTGNNYLRSTILDNSNSTSFVGAMLLADASVVVAFMEASSALRYAITYYRSTNPLATTPTWTRYRCEAFNAPIASAAMPSSDSLSSEGQRSAYFPQAHCVAPNGDWLRRVNFEDLGTSPNVAQCQRLTGDKTTATWAAAGTGLNATFGVDPSLHTVQVSRMKVISGGRILASGQLWRGVPGGTRSSLSYKFTNAEPFFAISTNNGTTWTPCLTSFPTGTQRFAPNEVDWDELADGSIQSVWRTGPVPFSGTSGLISTQYLQARATVSGTNTWAMQATTMTAFTPLPTNGPIHPGVVRDPNTGTMFFFSRSPVKSWYSINDGGQWTQLAFEGGTWDGTTGYYPRAIQLDTDTIGVFSHRGTDDVYGAVDNAIWMDRFDVLPAYDGTGGGTVAASVTISPNPGTVGTAVSFDMSTSTGAISAYELSFDNGSTWVSLGTATDYSRFFAQGTYKVIGRVTGVGTGNRATSTVQTLTINPVIQPPTNAIYLPYVPQISAKYTLTSPSGLKAVFNDPTDPDYVGDLVDVSGLDSAEVRESASDLAQADGGTHGDFFFGRRPITLTCRVYNTQTMLIRDTRIDKIRRVVKECMRGDGTLVWTNQPTAAYLPMMTTVRMQQPLRISGGWVKDILISMVSQYAQLFSADVQTTTKAAGAIDNNVRNRGDYPSYPVLRLSNPSSNAGASPALWQFPSLFNTGTGAQFRANLSVYPGEILEYDMLRHRGVVIQKAHSSYSSGTAGAAGTVINNTIDFQATKWPAVVPGTNTFQELHSGTAPSGCTWTLTWRSAWS